MALRSNAQAIDPGGGSNDSPSSAHGLLPDDMVLRRSAFDFLKSKGAIPSNVLFTRFEAQGVLHPISLEEFGRPNDTGTALCFHTSSLVSGLEVIFDNKYNVLGYYSSSQAEMICCFYEMLNVAERMEMIAFPVNHQDAVTRRKKRMRREEQPNYFERMPDACTLQVFTFATNMQDFLPIMQVCKHWRNLLNGNSVAADEVVWRPLCRRYFPELIKVQKAIRLEAGVTMQQLFVEQAKHGKKRFHQGFCLEECDVERRRYDYRQQDGAFQPFQFQAYMEAFTVVLWKIGGGCIHLNVRPTLGENGVIGLQLPDDLVLSMVLSTYVSLAIYFEHPIGGEPCMLYSGIMDYSGNEVVFDAFNRFEKFRVRSYFVGLRPHDQSPEDVRIAVPSAKPFFVDGFVSSSLKVQLYWQTENDGSAIPMSRQDALVFLEKGISPAEIPSLLSRPSGPSENWAMTRFSPRPLSSYGFLVGFRLDVGDTLPCLSDCVSRYYELTEMTWTDTGWVSCRCFNFDIPRECQDMIPSEDGKDGKCIEISVYVVDKMTGRQAVLYEDSEMLESYHDEETGEFRHLMESKYDSKCFDPSTFFSVRSPLSENYGTPVEVAATIYPERKPPALQMEVRWNYVQLGNNGMNECILPGL